MRLSRRPRRSEEATTVVAVGTGSAGLLRASRALSLGRRTHAAAARPGARTAPIPPALPAKE